MRLVHRKTTSSEAAKSARPGKFLVSCQPDDFMHPAAICSAVLDCYLDEHPLCIVLRSLRSVIVSMDSSLLVIAGNRCCLA